FRERKEEEAKLLREHNNQMEKRYEENIREMKKSSAEKDALNAEHRRRESEIIKTNEAKSAAERKAASERLDRINSDYNKNLEQKQRDLLDSKENANKEKLEIVNKSDKEKMELQTKHLEHLNEQQHKFLQQQQQTQANFEKETSSLRADAVRREQILKEEKIRAEEHFQRQMSEQVELSKEERLQMQKTHQEFIESKDAAIDTLRKETETRIDDLHEINRAQQARDLATLKQIEHERMEREKEMHDQLMEIHLKNQADRADLHEQMLEEKERSHAMLFLAMKQRQDDTHQYQQILSAVPRAISSEQQTSKLMSLKIKLQEASSQTDEAILNFEMAHDEFAGKKSPQNAAKMENSASELNECCKSLHRAVMDSINQLDSCSAVKAATRAEWRSLLTQLQIKTSSFTRSATKIMLQAKRKAVTPQMVAYLTEQFDKIKDAIFDLPSMHEESVMGMIESRQGAITQNHQDRFNLMGLNSDTSRLSLQAPVDPN
ncbi:hypothetical protein PFISCL1PPCAC_24927, partial [Pristionchus fissidentatus]